MGFLKFLLGIILILGSLAFGFSLLFMSTDIAWVFGIITFIALVGGVYLVRHH